MYVLVYSGHVHPGVNMVLGMGGLIGSNDTTAITAAGEEIKAWDTDASDRIVHLVSEVRNVIGFCFRAPITLER